MPRTLARFAIAIGLAGRLSAQSTPAFVPQPNALHSPGRDVTISLLTVGDGEQIWQLFGHSAFRIHDDVTGRDTVFNWGVFDPRIPYFIPHFLQGLMLYQMGGGTVEELLDSSRRENRTLMSQELDLTAAQKDSLLHLIQINARPENVQYRYDYFRNNCSTRPRDLLDQILGGQVHAASSQVMPTSYRWHALRQMQSDKLLVLGVDIGLGEPSDKPITKWDEMFLPREVHDLVATMQVHDSTGATHPLVRNARVFFQSTRPPEPSGPPNLAPWLTCIGVVVAGLFAWLGALALGGSRGAQIGAGILFALWSLVAGLLGVVLAALWTVTDHVFAHANENLLIFNPLWLALVVLLPMTLSSGRAARATRIIAGTLATLTAIALVAHVVRLSEQSNLAIVGLALPPALAIAWVASRRRA